MINKIPTTKNHFCNPRESAEGMDSFTNGKNMKYKNSAILPIIIALPVTLNPANISLKFYYSISLAGKTPAEKCGIKIGGGEQMDYINTK